MRQRVMCTLPDIFMYGGDTTPWLVTPRDDCGNLFDFDTLHGCQASLDIASTKNAVIGQDIRASSILCKPGVVNGHHFLFEFTEEETLNFAGSYIYQIGIHNKEEARYCQGILTVRANIQNIAEKGG